MTLRPNVGVYENATASGRSVTALIPYQHLQGTSYSRLRFTQHGDMLTKLTLAAAITIGAASAALAAPDTDPKGGYRELGPGGVVTDGVNPVYHPSMRNGGADYGYAPGASIVAPKRTHK